MAHQAMALKWRPRKFADLVGQEHVAKTLENAIQGDRLHHAFLFTGTRGVGKTTSARILAKTLNCANLEGLTPCGQCESCRSIDAANGASLDVLELDGASNNGVDDVRALIDQVQYAPMNGKYKIFIIDEVHMLTREAFNALLKTLEEPPPHVRFIFATTEVNKVPATILSRIQRFDFRRINPAQIADRLKYICEQEGIEASPEALAILAEQADGSMRDGLTFFDQVYSFSGKDLSLDAVRDALGIPSQDLYFSLMEAIAAHDQKACFSVVDEFMKGGIEIGRFLEGFSRFLRNMLLVMVDPKSDALEVSTSVVERMQNVSHSFQQGDIMRISRMLSDLQQQVRNSSLPRVTVEMALSRMAWLDRIVDIRKVLASGNAEKKN